MKPPFLPSTTTPRVPMSPPPGGWVGTALSTVPRSLLRPPAPPPGCPGTPRGALWGVGGRRAPGRAPPASSLRGALLMSLLRCRRGEGEADLWRDVHT